MKLTRTILGSALALGCLTFVEAQDAIELGDTWAYPSEAKGATSGFTGRIVQARKNAGLSATVARGNAHLRGALIDPATEMPYENLVVDTDNPVASNGDWSGTTPVSPGGAFAIEGVINFSSDNGGFLIEDGNFSEFDGTPDSHFPGMPGSDDDTFTLYENGQNFSLEVLTFLELPQGEIILGLHHDDAVELAVHPNDARDIFRQRIAGFDSNSGKAERTALLDVPVAGLYSVRILLAQWNGDATLEFYSADPADEVSLTLVNADDAGSIKAWQSLSTDSRPYVTAVSPDINATGVAKDTAIQVTIVHADDAEPEMKVNGEVVTVEKSVDGENTIFTHTPADPFESGQTVTVELSYGEATASWNFVTFSGRKALLITGGGQLNGADGWVAARLASKYGFDVTVKGDDNVSVDDAEGAALIFNSSTVNSGKVAPNDFELLPIPLVNVEGGNVDDFFLSDAPLSWGNGPNSGFDVVAITDEVHPMNAGLAPGEQKFSESKVQYHWAIPPEESVVIGRPPENEEQGTIFAIEAGAEMLDDVGDVLFTHPARRVFFGVTGNDGAASYTDIGVQLFDAAITWVLETPSAGGQPEIAGIDVAGTEVNVSFTTPVPESPHVLQRATNLQDWVVDSLAVLTQDGEIFQFATARDGANQGQFRVGVLPPPALFTEDFESGAEGWETEQVSGDTAWELGTPAVDGLTEAHGGTQVYGTDLDGDYGDLVNTSLLSPPIDLADVRRARLQFWYFVDTDEGAEGIQLRFLNESDGSVAVHDTILSGQSDGWVEFDEKVPSELIGSTIRLQFLFLTDGDAPYGAGFYLDDVVVDD